MICLSPNSYSNERYTLDFLAPELKKEFAPFFSVNYLINSEKNRLTKSAMARLKLLADMKINQIKEAAKLNINLITWPSEDRLIYKFGEKILKDKN